MCCNCCVVIVNKEMNYIYGYVYLSICVACMHMVTFMWINCTIKRNINETCSYKEGSTYD